MDPSHLLNEVVDADSMATDVKPVVTTPVLPEKATVGNVSDTSGCGSGSSGTDVAVFEQISQERILSNTGRSNEQPSDIENLLSEVVALRHAKCNIEEELLDVKKKFRELSSVNNELRSQVASSIDEANERSRMYRQLESSRNELAVQKMDLNSAVEKLRNEKEERDAAIRTLTREKQLIATENFALKDELQKILREKALLTQEKNNRDQEMRTLTSEREKARTESEMYTNSRKWFLEEIAQRDNKLAELRIELSSNMLSWHREKLILKDEVARLQLAAEEHEGQLQLRKKQVDDTLARITELSAEHNSSIADLEAELRKERELSGMYKESLEKAEHVAAEISEQWKARENLFEETKRVLTEVQEEIEEEKRMRNAEIAVKDEQINELREELSKANELLKSKHAVNLNVSEEELSILSPAAVETARLLRGGQSLTSIVREHARLSGELAECRERNRQLEMSLREMVEEIEDRAPQLFQQKDLLDKTFDDNNRLQEQLKEADEARCRLESVRDATSRELSFTRAELEKYQRDYAKASKQVQHLLFVLERERLNGEGDIVENDEENARLFNSIAQLQKINRQLESELEVAKTSAEQVVLTSKNAEIECLKRELESSRKTENSLKGELEQMRTTFELLQSQTEQLKKLADDNVSVVEARSAKIKAEEAVAKALASDVKVARLEEYIRALKEEKEISERIHSDRVARSEEIISEVKMTNARLEASFEMQKQTTAELDHARKEQDQIREENDRVECRAAKEELEHACLTIKRLESEVEAFRRTSFSEQQMMLSLNEMTARLSRIESEKMAQLGSQIDVVRLERDSLKISNARLTDQLSHSRNEAKQTQIRYEQEISLVRQQLGEKEKELTLSERQLIELRTRLSSMQAQYTAQESTLGMTPERLQKECQQLKNRSQYLECQLDELKSKLAEAECVAIKKSDENDRMESHSKVMESSLKHMAEMGSMERERLEARANSAELRAAELTKKVAELSTTINQLESEISDMKLDHLKMSSELQLKIDILEAQVKDADSSVVNLNELLSAARSDVEKGISERNELTNQLDELKSLIVEKEEEIALKNAKLDSKEKEIFSTREGVRVAEESLRETEKLLASRADEMAAIENKYNESIKNYEEKLDHMLEKYENVASQVCSRGSGSTDLKEPDTSSGNEDSSLAIVESLQSVVKFLREEKQSAVARCMAAEIEVKRLRAEVSEIRAGRDELAATVRHLQSEVVASADALAERAQLLERLEMMASVQRQNTMYRCENEKLHKVSSELSKQKREAETKVSEITAAASDASSKITLLSSELATKKKENDLLRQRVAEATLKGDQEVKARVKELVAKHNDTCTKFEATRKLARRYRDESTEDKQKIANLESELSRLKSVSASCTTSDATSSQDMSAMRERLNSLEAENAKLTNDLTSKIAEYEEVKFRLSAMGPSFENAQARVTQLSAEKSDLLTRIASLEAQISGIYSADQHRPSVSLSASSVMSTGSLPDSVAWTGNSASTPKRVAFDSPVHYQNSPAITTVADTISGNTSSEATQSPIGKAVSSASLASQVPKLFKSSVEPAFSSTQTTSAPPADEAHGSCVADMPQDSGQTVQVVPSSPITYSLATSSAARISPGQSLFGKSAPIVTASVSTSTKSTTEGSISVVTEAEQSSQVSGSGEIRGREDDDGAGHNGISFFFSRDFGLLNYKYTKDLHSAGESRDSGSGMPVSSSDGRRKRAVAIQSSSESKRHRDSPSEIVTSSEERRDLDVIPERGMAVAADMEGVDVPDDAEGDDDIEVLEEGQDDSTQHIELLSDEDVSEQSMDDFEEEDDDGGMESDEEIDNGESADVVVLSDGEDAEEIGEVEMEDDHGDDELDGDGLVVSQDDEVLGADDNSLDAPAAEDFIDDEDREAASAVEEADDEGRTDTGSSAMAGAPSSIRHTGNGSSMTSSSASASMPATARLRIPIVYGAEDQCSSSNESGSTQFPRRRRPITIYQPGGRSLTHPTPSSVQQEASIERMSARMRGRARAALRSRGKGRGAKH
ncbi:unnamed protein product [Angiostrongylus costaricensis]|uniref:TPR_MLP1_2 domain-containing protein n=1 Tax=Angiostrongylus costaricensis TaxID=334426 RepID=A0A158PIM0_ANGCS|nr:unnamed protein product [Angiostrongylus costaricensis]